MYKLIPSSFVACLYKGNIQSLGLIRSQHVCMSDPHDLQKALLSRNQQNKGHHSIR